MDIWVINGIIINGDGQKTPENGMIRIRDGIIDRLDYTKKPLKPSETTIIDAKGGYILPGIFNAHTHGCTNGPLFSSGALGPSEEEASANIIRHLLQGETTLLDMSGLGTDEDILQKSQQLPVRIGIGTCHFKETFSAADMVDGSGIMERHRKMTAGQMLKSQYVTAIGEIGSGATLGGGVASYRYIPAEIKRITGKAIGWKEAEKLKRSVLSEDSLTQDSVKNTLIDIGLSAHLSTKEAIEMVNRIARAPVKTALSGFDPAAKLSSETGVPAVFHTSMESVETLFETGLKYANTQARIIAAHANHTSMSERNCVIWAKKLKDYGVGIDIATVQCFSGQKDILRNSRALISEGLVDMISTDYGGGKWDPILSLLEYISDEGLLTLSRAVSLATSSPASWFSGIGSRLGLLKPGYKADLIITSPGKLSDVRMVFIEGKCAVKRDL